MSVLVCRHHNILVPGLPTHHVLGHSPICAGNLRSKEGCAVVEECHARYCKALMALYNKHKDEYAPNRVRDMRIVE